MRLVRSLDRIVRELDSAPLLSQFPYTRSSPAANDSKNLFEIKTAFIHQSFSAYEYILLPIQKQQLKNRHTLNIAMKPPRVINPIRIQLKIKQDKISLLNYSFEYNAGLELNASDPTDSPAIVNNLSAYYEANLKLEFRFNFKIKTYKGEILSYYGKNSLILYFEIKILLINSAQAQR